MKEIRILENADNKHFMPRDVGIGFIGCVDEVNGNGAAEVSGFVPTRHELLQLVEYWERVVLKIGFWQWFITGVVGSSDRRLREFALCRIDRIWNLLGKEEVKPAIDRVYAKFEKDVDPRLWNIFLHGDDAQWKAVQEETYRQLGEEES